MVKIGCERENEYSLILFFFNVTKFAHLMFLNWEITRSQQILSEDCYRLLLIDKKINFSNKFKLKLITIYYLKFVVKVLWESCGQNTSLPTSTSKVQILVN